MTVAEHYEALIAWALGEISIGQATKLTGLDEVGVRWVAEQSVKRTQQRWTQWRKCNPVSPEQAELVRLTAETEEL